MTRGRVGRNWGQTPISKFRVIGVRPQFPKLNPKSRDLMSAQRLTGTVVVGAMPFSW